MANPSEILVSKSAPVVSCEPQRATHEVSGVLLRVLADVVGPYGVTPAVLFQEKGRSLLTGEPMAIRVPLSEFRSYLTRAMTLTGYQAIGLRCALYASESAFDLMAPLIAHVPTLRRALHETKQFQALVFEGAYLHLTESFGGACVRWEFPRSHDATDRCIAEFLTAGLLRMLRGFGCTREDLYSVRFEHRRPTCEAEYAKVFEGAERFSQDFTGVEFSAAVLDRPHLLSNPGLQDMVHALAEQRLVRLSRTQSLVDRLRMYLLNQPAARVPDMRVAAHDLRVSVRSLRRRLAEEGLSYRELTNELQRERACVMMRNPEFTLKAVADALGFADMAGFYRAFKRWTGVTAKGYRRSH